MLMWGVAVPILICTLFRLGLGLSLLFAQEFFAFFGGEALIGSSGSAAAVAVGAVEEAGGERGEGGILPGLQRICWGGWVDLLGDWCGGVSLMIGGCFSALPRLTVRLFFLGVYGVVIVVGGFDWWVCYR